MPASSLASHRLTAALAIVVAALQVIPLGRLLMLAGTGPSEPGWTYDVVVLLLLSASALVTLAAGAWRMLRHGRNLAGLKLVLAGSCLTLISLPYQGAVFALVLAVLSGVQLARLQRQRAASSGSPAAQVEDTRAMHILFVLTLAAPLVVLAGVGCYAKITLDRAGQPTLSWSHGIGYSMLLVLPLAAAFVVLAIGARRYLRRKLATDPAWVARIGVPCWAAALLGAVAGGTYALWPMMMNVEASMIAILMPWWFAQWELAGGVVAGAVAYLLTRIARGR